VRSRRAVGPCRVAGPCRAGTVTRILLLAVLVASCSADGDGGEQAGDDPEIEDGSEAIPDDTSDDLPAAEDEDPDGDGGNDGDEQAFPDVVDAELEPVGDDTWRVSATISSPYDTPERYADAFRVSTPDGAVLGVRELLHDHANEQPFTRSLEDVEIPADVERVIVEGRDLRNGWGGTTVEVPVPS
jgi:hypothetical protein